MTRTAVLSFTSLLSIRAAVATALLELLVGSCEACPCRS
jgi:hypothetical protein